MKLLKLLTLFLCVQLAACGAGKTPNHPGEYPDNLISRDTLVQYGDQWLDAVGQGFYDQLPLSSDVRFTHNANVKELNATTLPARDVSERRYYADEDKGQIVVFADTPDGPYNARLRINGDEITEIESWQGVGRNYWGQGAESKNPMTRERLIQLTEAHLDALQTGLPFAKYTADVIRTDNGHPFYGLPTCIGILCAGEMPVLGVAIKKVADRRKVIDTKYNVVVTWIEWHFIDGSVLPMSARFVMRNDAISLIEVTFASDGVNHTPDWINIFQPETP